MSEHAYPPPEHADGYLTEIVFEQAGEIRELSEDCDTERERADRFDEGLCAMQWTLSANPNLAVMLRGVVRYGQTGLRSEWLGKALGGVGK